MPALRITRGRVSPNAGLDVTVRSAGPLGRFFAPTWDMVLGHKSGELSDLEYVDRYCDLLDSVPAEAWSQFALQEREGFIRVLCYCPDYAQFCHTYALAAYAEASWPELFVDATARCQCTAPWRLEVYRRGASRPNA